MKVSVLVAALMSVCAVCNAAQSMNADERKEKTVFQTSQQWKATTDNRADVAIVYGVGGNPGERRARVSFEDRVASWRKAGYGTYFMTGIAWGEYRDYFTGEWDGKWHLDEGQVTMNGDTIWHGRMVPYIVPSMNFIKYMKEKHIKRVIDAGIDAIYLEEPEFWARGGYSEAFKREWQDYYGFAWRPQHESAENTYLSNKLKYHLYYRALNECFSYAKAYGASKGMDVKCYVPTHSLVNYSAWQIVSPEASLASLDCVDGYIAQVWTGTSRAANYYSGVKRERVFENAYLEYGCMESMTAPTGRKVWFLTDPIEDNANKDWTDYKRNYEATFAAQLMYPQNDRFEVMPWPDRIYEGKYNTSATDPTKINIPRFYSTQMHVMINSLNSMPKSENRVSGSDGISVLMANSMMFQRAPTAVAGYDDPELSNFYGLSMPLVKRGVPVKILHIENTKYCACWDGVKVLLASYANMKPLDAEAHTQIAEWVRRGGVLIYSSRDDDAYQSVLEWWNTGDKKYHCAADHLFSLMGIPEGAAEGEYRYGDGVVRIVRHDPKEYVLAENGEKGFVDEVVRLYNNVSAEPLVEKNSFALTRGAYEIISVIDEGVTTDAYVADGLFIDLFDPNLPVVDKKVVNPGERAYLYNLSHENGSKAAKVLAGSARVYDETHSKNGYGFVAKSPINTDGVMRVLLPKRPKQVLINSATTTIEWDKRSHTCLLRFENDPAGVVVDIRW